MKWRNEVARGGYMPNESTVVETYLDVRPEAENELAEAQWERAKVRVKEKLREVKQAEKVFDVLRKELDELMGREIDETDPVEGGIVLHSGVDIAFPTLKLG